MDEWLQERGVTLIGADLDESPMPYRRLPEVLAYHTNSARISHTLCSFGVVMAGAAADMRSVRAGMALVDHEGKPASTVACRCL